MNERVKGLKKKVISKAASGGFYVEPIYVDLERSRLWTEVYKKADAEPEVFKRAKALKNVLENMSIYIKDNELIVGCQTGDPASIPSSFELCDLALQQCKRDGYVRKEDEVEFDELAKYWENRSLWGRSKNEAPIEDFDQATGETFISGSVRDGEGTCAPDYNFIFRHGYRGIINIIENKLIELAKITTGPELNNVLKKRRQYKAEIMTCEAAIKWAKRFGELAREQAENITESTRKNELIEIAEVCEKCIEQPVETFHEAVQAMWFIQVITHYLEQSSAGTSVRIDQILYPYYENDLKNNRITRERALEMLECLWIKFLEVGQARTHLYREAFQGAPSVGPLVYTIAGVKQDGTDACNEITKLCMEATKDTRAIVPSLSLRYHSDIPSEIVDSAYDVISTGMAIPSFENDAIAIPMLQEYGCTLEQARDWANILCKSPGSVAEGVGTPRRHPWSLNCIGNLIVMLHDGVDVISGKQFGESYDAANFKTIDDVIDAFTGQLISTLDIGCKLRTIGRCMEAEYLPRPFLSSCYGSYIDLGLDTTEKDIISWPWINLVGLVDAGDSLTAIRKLVFDDKKYTIPQLIEALANDWKGYESMQQDFINAPKWGNDDEYGDWGAIKIYDICCEEIYKFTDFSGAHYKPVPQAVSLFWQMGKRTAATPNGRNAKDVINDGGSSPGYGSDKKGPTAVLISNAKLDPSKSKGILLNQRLNASIMKGEKGKMLFHNYLKTWADLKIQHVQLNVVDGAVMKAAQKVPEKYPDLVVRVAGYSAYFTSLERTTQDSIINRTDQLIAS